MQEVIRILKQSWKIILIIISAIVAVGAIQIDFVSIKIPSRLLPFFVAFIVLAITIVTLIISLINTRKFSKLYYELKDKQEKIQEKGPILFIEDVPIQGLAAHVTKRAGKSINQVHLNLIELAVSVKGIGPKRDASMSWRFVGTNLSPKPLTNIELSIAGETLIPINELGCAIFDLKEDSPRKNKILPILVGEDSTNKNILLPFQSPGINQYENFDIELSYIWPAIVNIRKDYWFIDPINYAPTIEKIRFIFEYDNPILIAAYAFELNISTEVAEFQGSILIQQNGNKQSCVYEINNPKENVFYVIVFEGNYTEN